ncbi:MAG: addiction module protein [Pseudomonadota bacterium]
MDFETIRNEALDLPPDHRAKLARELILSLESLSEEEIEESWLVEADRRAREIDQRHVRLIPAEEVQRKARALLK